ncbi:MAG: hypothetical protein KAI84_01030, partial [Gammaproteobacteria bacterium]|nr:hypothetical protein [Gammaproteobacteria bacterium]
MSLFGNEKASGNALNNEIARVAKLVNNGELDARMSVKAVGGDEDTANAINSMLDSIVGPLNV